MSIPAQAFGEVYAKALPLGSVLKYYDHWAILVGDGEAKPKDLLYLEGPYAGQLKKLGTGMAKSVAVVAPFGWYPSVAEGAHPTKTDHRTAALTLAGSELRIIGASIEHGDTDYVAYRLDGTEDSEYQPYGAEVRFMDWSAQLVHTDRPFKSLGQLFSINAGPKA